MTNGWGSRDCGSRGVRVELGSQWDWVEWGGQVELEAITLPYKAGDNFVLDEPFNSA